MKAICLFLVAVGALSCTTTPVAPDSSHRPQAPRIFALADHEQESAERLRADSEKKMVGDFLKTIPVRERAIPLVDKEFKSLCNDENIKQAAADYQRLLKITTVWPSYRSENLAQVFYRPGARGMVLLGAPKIKKSPHFKCPQQPKMTYLPIEFIAPDNEGIDVVPASDTGHVFAQKQYPTLFPLAKQTRKLVAAISAPTTFLADVAVAEWDPDWEQTMTPAEIVQHRNMIDLNRQQIENRQQLMLMTSLHRFFHGFQSQWRSSGTALNRNVVAQCIQDEEWKNEVLRELDLVGRLFDILEQTDHTQVRDLIRELVAARHHDRDNVRKAQCWQEYEHMEAVEGTAAYFEYGMAKQGKLLGAFLGDYVRFEAHHDEKRIRQGLAHGVSSAYYRTGLLLLMLIENLSPDRSWQREIEGGKTPFAVLAARASEPLPP